LDPKGDPVTGLLQLKNKKHDVFGKHGACASTQHSKQTNLAVVSQIQMAVWSHHQISKAARLELAHRKIGHPQNYPAF
jgi:hypothetical protein